MQTSRLGHGNGWRICVKEHNNINVISSFFNFLHSSLEYEMKYQKQPSSSINPTPHHYLHLFPLIKLGKTARRVGNPNYQNTTTDSKNPEDFSVIPVIF